jgi:acyl-CoA thioester hydrolase
MDQYPLKMEVRIDWSEIDAFGHVNNLAILKYVQAARVKYLETIGLMQSQAEIKIGPILASTSCQYRKPLFYPGQVTVHSTVDAIKNTSFRMCHVVHNERSEIVAEAQDILVLFNFDKQTKLAIPDDLRQRIGKLQNVNCSSASVAQPHGAGTRTD